MTCKVLGTYCVFNKHILTGCLLKISYCIQPRKKIFLRCNAQLIVEQLVCGKDENPILCERATMLARYPSREIRLQGNLIKHISHCPERGSAVGGDTCLPEVSSSSSRFINCNQIWLQMLPKQGSPKVRWLDANLGWIPLWDFQSFKVKITWLHKL